jgi:hypothetical protein
MKPIEKMAKAYVDDGDHYISDALRITWIDLKHDQKREVCKGIRRALLALAEAELSEEAIDAAQSNPSQFAADPTQWHIGSFRAILRHLAEEDGR